MNKSDEITNKSLSELEKKLKKTYTQSYNELKKKTTQYFGDMGRREVELIEGLDSGSIKLLPNETKEEYLKQWRQAQMGRGKRWQALRDNMAKQIAKTNEIASAYINDKTPSIYSINANYQAYEIGKGLKGVDFTMYDEQTVKNLITENGNYTEFKTVKVNPVRDYEWNSEQIQNALTAGILQGQKIDQIADSFQTVMKRNQASAIRNARTAYTSAQNGGRLNGLKQAKAQGINVRKQWLSAHDGRVRDSHAMLNGQIRDIEERFDNGLMFPADSEGRPAEVYNCRCTLTYIYTDWDKDKSSEIYRDEALAGETYSQFVKRMKEENPEYIDQNKNRYNYNALHNYAKITDAMHYSDDIAEHKFTKEIIIDNLNTSSIGKHAIDYIENNNISIQIIDEIQYLDIRAEHIGNQIKIYSSNITKEVVAGQSVIHEVAHIEYNIGHCQHAEAICFAHEKMHILGRDYLTADEWDYCKKLAIQAYPEYNWEVGGYGNYDQFDFIRL